MANERLSLDISVKTSGAESIDALNSSLGRTAAAVKEASIAPNPAAFTNFAKQAGAAFEHGVVPQVAAASAAVRAFEGTLSIRAVERFLTSVLPLGPALQAIFPIIGATAFIAVIAEGAQKVVEFAKKWDSVYSAQERAKQNAIEYGEEIHKIGQEIKALDLSALTKALGTGEGGVVGATQDSQEARLYRLNAQALSQQMAGEKASIKAAQGTIDQHRDDDPGPRGNQAVTSANREIARATAEIADLQTRIGFFETKATELEARASGKFGDSAQTKTDEIQSKLDEASNRATEIEKRVAEYERRGQLASATSIERILADSDSQLSEPGLGSRQKDRLRMSGALIGDAEIQRQADSQQHFKLQLSDLGTSGFRDPQKGDPKIAAEIEEGSKILERRAADLLKALKLAGEALKKEDTQNIAGIRSGAEHSARLVELNAKDTPGGQIAALDEELRIRKQAAQKEFDIKKAHASLYDLKAERFALDREMQTAEFKHEESLIELRNKQIASFRDSVTHGVDDLISGKGLGSSLKAFGQGFEHQVIGNIAEMIYPQIQKMTAGLKVGGNGTLGKILSGTPFGADPAKASTDLNTTATDRNTAAVDKVTAAMSASGGGGSAGGGAAGSAGNLANVLGAGGGSAPTATSDPGSGEAQEYNGYGQSVGSTIPSNGSKFAGKAAAVTAAVGGGFAAYNDFKTGGAKNDLAGVGAALGSAASVAMLFGPAGLPVAIGLGIASAVTTLAAGFVPDPKAKRAYQIEHDELERNKYNAPVALNVSQDSSGNYTDFDARGNLRQSPFRAVPQVSQPYIWWKGNTPYDAPGSVTSPYQQQAAPQITVNLNAIDTQSGVDFLRNNKAVVSDAVADHLQNTEGRLHSAIRYAAQR